VPRLTCRRGARSRLRIAALAALLVLSGCQYLPSFSSTSSKNPPAAQACPSVVILRPLANTAAFGPGPKRGPDNVTFYGLLSEGSVKCETTGDTLRMKLDVIVIGERGLVAKGNIADFNYFVAVVGPNQAILSKRPFAVRIDLAGEKRAGVTDHIEESIPLGGRKPTELTVDIGFQLSPDVVEFYKHFRGR
jgi:hypothetical protein